jgi:hypothetical protein
MSATTIAPYGQNGQKDVCFSRMLKKSASGVLVLNASSTYPWGTPPVRSSTAALLDALFEHPAGEFCTWRFVWHSVRLVNAQRIFAE